MQNSAGRGRKVETLHNPAKQCNYVVQTRQTICLDSGIAFIFLFTFEVSGCDYFFGFVVMTDLVGISGQIVPSSFWETKVVAIVKGISVENVHLLYVSDNLPWAFRCRIAC
jgi:hypothetical protein